MSIQASFNPNYGAGVTVAPTSTAASLTLPNKTKSVLLTNLGLSVTVYVRISSDGSTATVADYPLLPATQVTLSKSDDDLTVSYVTSSGTGSLHVMPGEGY